MEKGLGGVGEVGGSIDPLIVAGDGWCMMPSLVPPACRAAAAPP